MPMWPILDGAKDSGIAERAKRVICKQYLQLPNRGRLEQFQRSIAYTAI